MQMRRNTVDSCHLQLTWCLTSLGGMAVVGTYGDYSSFGNASDLVEDLLQDLSDQLRLWPRSSDQIHHRFDLTLFYPRQSLLNLIRVGKYIRWRYLLENSCRCQTTEI
ncbi:hypothetical protein N431DRAFT_116581 [Stipitochalara longipes BDJ]|nr:hypothetical protein N431DRAFT_116581 [Stipitochalara longipes BDJ]